MTTLNDEYKIGINIDVNGESIDMFSQLNDLIDKLTYNFSDLTDRISSFNDELSTTSNLFRLINSSIIDFGEGASKSLDAAALNVNRLNAAMAQTVGISRAMQIGEGGAVFSDRHKGSFSERIGHHLLRDSLGPTGGIIARALAPEVVIPVAITAGLAKSGFEAAATWQAQIQSLKGSGFIAEKGFGESFVQQSITAAKTENIPGISRLDYLTAIQESAAVTRNSKQALLLAPILAKMTLSNQLLYSTQDRKFTPTDELNLARFAEMIVHGNTAEKITRGLNLVQQFYGTEQGKIKSYDILGLAKRDAAGIAEMSRAGLFELVPLVQKVGGSQLGSELRTMQSQLMRGQNFRTGKKALARLEDLGVFNKNKQANDLNLLQKNPAEWVNKFLIPQFSKHGITTDAQIQQELRKDFGGKIPDLLYLLFTNRAQELESLKTGQRAFTTGQAWTASQKLNEAAIKRASAAWTSFSVAMGQLTSPVIVGGLNALTIVLDRLTKILNFFNEEGLSKFEKSSATSFSKTHPSMYKGLHEWINGGFASWVNNKFHSGGTGLLFRNENSKNYDAANAVSKSVSHGVENLPNLYKNALKNQNMLFRNMNSKNYVNGNMNGNVGPSVALHLKSIKSHSENLKKIVGPIDNLLFRNENSKNYVRTNTGAHDKKIEAHVYLDGEEITNNSIKHINKKANYPLSTGNSVLDNYAFINPSLNTINGGSY